VVLIAAAEARVGKAGEVIIAVAVVVLVVVVVVVLVLFASFRLKSISTMILVLPC